MKSTELIGVTLGVLMWGGPSLFFDTPLPIYITPVALAGAAVGLALFHPGARWQTGSGIGPGVLTFVILSIFIDSSNDPGSHNLAPFEILAALIIGWLPAILGVFIGNLIGRRLPRLQHFGILLVTLSVGLVAVSVATILSNSIREEALALKKIKALIAAQHEFRAAYPLRGYTCDLRELGEPFSGPIKSISAWWFRIDGAVYSGGTGAYDGENYRYALKCKKNKQDPQDSFALIARARRSVGWREHGERPYTFCVGPDGAIRSISGGRMYFCFNEGQIVQKVN